jgi:tRNA(Ile)-lysidine synthase
MLRAGDRVAVAVSGGPDSVALLWALWELRAELGLLLSVAHVNHGLRGAESDADEEFTRRLADSLGLDCLVERARLGETEENVEQAGRTLRLGFYRRLLAEKRADKVATGHTRTDQAETVLFRILRGAGTAGLAGIRPVLEGRIVRPLIEVEREQVLEYLRAGGRSWREDSSNRNLALSRNRLRHELLPLLRRDWNPAIVQTLAHVAEWARGEEEYWEAALAELEKGCLRMDGPAAYLDAPLAAALPAAAERRLLRRAVERVKGGLLGIEFGHIEQIRALTAQQEGHGRIRIPGVDVWRSFHQLRLGPAGEDAELKRRDFAVPLVGPGTYAIPHTPKRLSLELRETSAAKQRYNETLMGLDWDRVPRPLWLRNWRPGDQYQPAGQGGSRKLKTLFQERRIPLWERRQWPVVASESEVIWARGFGPASALLAGPGTRVVLEITELDAAQPGSNV